MKIHFLLPALLSAFSIVSLSAQEQTKKEHPYFCGHDIVLESNEQQFPGFREAVARTFADARLRASAMQQRDRSQTYSIKVVVHVVWRNPEENLHDSVIYNQIDRLNEDFRRLNEDADNIREIFEDRQADALIEFEVAEIRRVQTNASFTPFLITLPDEVKRSNQGGSNAADPSRYLNIWICKIQPIPFIGGQVFGYAYPPAGLTNWPAGASAPSPEVDGVVVDFRCIGSNNPNPMEVPGFGVIPQNGRTMVHEVGHYLGLRHIWGDGGGIFGGNSCAEDDGVEDTPNQGAASNYDCNPQQNTCTDDNEPDMIENYMDYSDQECQNTFTHGQVAIMRAVLEGPRNGLLEVNTSVNNAALHKTWNIFPNPCGDRLYLTLDANHPVENAQWNVYNLQGSQVLNLEVAPGQAGNIELDLSQLPAGMYILRHKNQAVKFNRLP
jgi:hypothetical protein